HTQCNAEMGTDVAATGAMSPRRPAARGAGRHPDEATRGSAALFAVQGDCYRSPALAARRQESAGDVDDKTGRVGAGQGDAHRAAGAVRFPRITAEVAGPSAVREHDSRLVGPADV